MNPNPEKLEKLVHETLRDLPTRRAPRSLEARVMAEIARRQALPWWHRSWAYWPAGIRWTFLVLSAAVAAVIIFGSVTLLQGASSTPLAQVVRPISWAQTTWEALRSVASAVRDLFRLIPSMWLYGILAVFASLYVTVVGLGATAYRLLWQAR
jgi:hypothetical protein